MPTKEFYDQLVATMKNLAAPANQQKIVIESREHKESIDLAKLQTSMLRLMYANSNIDWDKGTIKNIHLATFAQGYMNLLDQSATVQATQLAYVSSRICACPDLGEPSHAHRAFFRESNAFMAYVQTE